MMDHWEIGVVLALRDAQWKAANPSAKIPAMNISLDGNAESKMGDAVHEIGERFALLEIKPDQSLCKSEWTASGGPKRAYKKLMDLAAINEVNPSDIPTRLRLSQSVRGHFFAYWGEAGEDTIHFDQLFLQPYLLTALNEVPKGCHLIKPGSCYSGRPSSAQAAALIDSFTIGLADSRRFYTLWPLSLKQVLFGVEHQPHFCLKQPSAKFVTASDLAPLGLEIDELQDYVNFLCKEKTTDGCKTDSLEEELKMILIGDRGFIRHVTHTSKLMQVVLNYKEDSLTPTVGRKPKLISMSPLKIADLEDTPTTPAP